MDSKKIYLTKEGLGELKTEFEELSKTKRPDVLARVSQARSMGDLSENADYHKAKEDQGFLEGRIQELDFMFRNAIIVEQTSGPKNIVAVGVHVTVQEENLEPEVYHLVGAKEADPRHGKISHESHRSP